MLLDTQAVKTILLEIPALGRQVFSSSLVKWWIFILLNFAFTKDALIFHITRIPVSNVAIEYVNKHCYTFSVVNILNYEIIFKFFLIVTGKLIPFFLLIGKVWLEPTASRLQQWAPPTVQQALVTINTLLVENFREALSYFLMRIQKNMMQSGLPLHQWFHST